MARDPKVTRKAYEYKLGKDLASKLDDKQIYLLSQYYNSLSDKETNDIDSQIVQGRNNTELHEMAIGMVEENESKKTPPKPKAKAKPKPKAKPKKVYDKDRSVAYKLPNHILKDLDEDQIRDLSSYYNSLPPDQKRKVDSEIVKGSGDLMDLARQMSDPLQEKYNTGGLDTWTGKPKDNSNAKQGPMPMPSAKKKPDKKAVTALVKKFSADKKDTKQPTNETIDPEVLNMLGLDDISDFDYDDYKTLLKEKMLANQMVGGRGDNDLLKNEFKRVKSKTGRFKPKKKTVNVSKVVQSGKKYNKSAVNTQKLLSGSKEAESTKTQVKGNAVADSFANIGLTLLGIDSLLKGLLGEEKKESEQDAKTARKSAQKEEEAKSEKAAKTKATKSLKGFKAPKMGFLDMIKRFFKNILLGGFILKALDWFQKEENQKKIQNVITFITDNLDKILVGIAALVGIGIGVKILGFLTLFTPLIGVMAVALKGLVGVLFALPAAIAAIPGIVPIAIVAGTALLLKGGYDLTRNYITGGEAQTKIHDVLDQQLVDAGVNPLSGVANYRPGAKRLPGPGGTGYERSPEQEKLYQEILKKRKAIKEITDKREKNKEAIDTDFEARIRKVEDDPNNFTRGAFNIKNLTQEAKDEIAKLKRMQSKRKLRENLLTRLALVNFLNPEVEAEMRKKGYSETQLQYFRWLALTYGDKLTPEMIEDPKNIEKFIKDSGLDDPSKDLNKPTPTVTPQSQVIPSPDGTPDVIIPLDHARGRIPDKTGGNTFTAAGQTGAYNPITGSTERDYQDPAAAMLQAELAKSGVKAKIVRPEDFASYEEYDNFLKKMDNAGVVSVPLHFDAIRSASGIGYLTRTRSGDAGDAKLATPINEVLKQFQGENTDTGTFAPDTKQNTTVDLSRKSPAALVELGIMAELEAKFGKNYTKHPKFIKLIQGLSGAIIEGGGFSTPSGMQEVKPGHNRPEPPNPPNTDPAPVVIDPGGGGGSGDTEISSASNGRQAAASFSSTDGNNPNPTQVGAIFNLAVVG